MSERISYFKCYAVSVDTNGHKAPSATKNVIFSKETEADENKIWLSVKQ